jgi:hypothetical protein
MATALVLTDLGADRMLEIILNNSWPAGGNNLRLELFATNVTPLDSVAYADYTLATGGGYAHKDLTRGSWTINSDAIINATYAEQTFTFTGALTTNGTLYGYLVVDDDNIVWWAQKFDSTFTPANNGDQLKLTPKIELSKGTPS